MDQFLTKSSVISEGPGTKQMHWILFSQNVVSNPSGIALVGTQNTSNLLMDQFKEKSVSCTERSVQQTHY